jgi:hypothetical protein
VNLVGEQVVGGRGRRHEVHTVTLRRFDEPPSSRDERISTDRHSQDHAGSGNLARVNESEVADILLAVVDSPPQSRSAAENLEATLSEASEVAGVEDFVAALSMFEPSKTPSGQLIGFDGLRSAAREALHDLGRHDRCMHEVPLSDRP